MSDVPMIDLKIYRPGKKFPALSVTGYECALDCAHCGGRYLRHMIPAPPPADFQRFMERLKEQGAVGFLLSGGCDPMGRVPIGPYLTCLKEARHLGLQTNVHTGVLDPGLPPLLCSAEPAAVSVDMVGSYAAIREVYGLLHSPADCARAVKELVEVGLNVVPHITVGLHGGQPSGEERALILLQDTGVRRLILNIFVPTKGTRYEDAPKISEARALEIIRSARRSLPGVEIILGCMRPRGAQDLHLIGLVDGIVNPSRRAVEHLGGAREQCTCCAIPFRSA
ncbi:MAG: radical SAM protein [Candidatus Thermoplasmatota archaeon]